MAEVRYVPATTPESWRVALAPGAIVALPPNVSVPTVEAVWRRLGDRGIGAVIEALTGSFGTSLAAIPDFLLAIVEDGGVRVAVRGPVELIVETSAGPEAVSGSGVATWVERFIPGALRVSAGLALRADEASSLPIVEGIVAVDAMALTFGSSRPAPRAAAPVRVPAAPAAAPVAPAVEGAVEGAAEGAAEPDDEGDASADPVNETVTDAVPDTLAAVASDDVPTAVASDDAPDAATAAADHEMVWGETVVRPMQPTVSESDGAEIGATVDATIVADRGAASEQRGDHDGETIAVADIRGIRRQSGTGAAEPPAAAIDSVPGAADGPDEETETASGDEVSRGRIRISDGQVVDLENTVIVGRRPRSPRSSGAGLPTLVAVDSPEQDISRNHVEIRPEGEHVLVVDLDTTNGTVLLRGGHDPVRLHPNEPTMIVSGDVLDIGDGVKIAFEDLL